VVVLQALPDGQSPGAEHPGGAAGAHTSRNAVGVTMRLPNLTVKTERCERRA
jgi:hypothetical protein